MIALSGCAHASTSLLSASLNPQDWLEYKHRFIKQQGYVIDTGQDDAVHSEGQSYGMLLAVFYNDKTVFDHLWQWTATHLQVRKDSLFAWKWDQKTGRAADTNNATDADLSIAWSLYLASEKWHEPEYKVSADIILHDIKPLLHEQDGRLYLLPGSEGFKHKSGFEINPSYLILPAFKFFSTHEPLLNWPKLYQNSIDLLHTSRYGKWQLTPDWLDVQKNGFKPSRQHKHQFSYDAIRVPLFAAWSGQVQLLIPYLNFWKQFDMQQHIPDRVDLDTNAIHFGKNFSAPSAIFALCRKLTGDKQVLFPQMQWTPHTTYYDASLTMFTQIAWIRNLSTDGAH